jgi:hypothetical protein
MSSAFEGAEGGAYKRTCPPLSRGQKEGRIRGHVLRFRGGRRRGV